MYAMRQFAADVRPPYSEVASANVLEMLGTMETGLVGQAGGIRVTSKGSGWDPLARIPVFRDGKPSGFVDRPDNDAAHTAMVHSDLPRDVGIQLCLVSASHREHWIAGDFVGISVENGVVHFSGEVDSIHGVLALRKIAAATPGTRAIIDDLWVACE